VIAWGEWVKSCNLEGVSQILPCVGRKFTESYAAVDG
jgi:hypothetical protein